MSTGRLVRPMEFQEHYTCDLCGGGVIVTATGQEDTPYHVRCADCDGEFFVSEWSAGRQKTDWYEITQGLPEHLRQIAERLWAREPPAAPVSYGEAVAALYPE